MTLFCLPFMLIGQIKVEKEFRIKRSEVPPKALNFIDQISFDEKLKWYREEQLKKHSIEAKSELFDWDVSIEFDTLGVLEDIEFDCDEDDLDEELLNKIEAELDQRHDRYKIFKCQYQLRGKESDLIKLLQSEPNFDELEVRYELVVRTTTDGKHEKWEYLFEYDGTFLSRAVFILNNTDVLEY